MGVDGEAASPLGVVADVDLRLHAFGCWRGPSAKKTFHLFVE